MAKKTTDRPSSRDSIEMLAKFSQSALLVVEDRALQLSAKTGRLLWAGGFLIMVNNRSAAWLRG